MLSIKLYQCAETKYKVKNGGQIAIQEERLITGGGNPADQANLEVATLITKTKMSQPEHVTGTQDQAK